MSNLATVKSLPTHMGVKPGTPSKGEPSRRNLLRSEAEAERIWPTRGYSHVTDSPALAQQLDAIVSNDGEGTTKIQRDASIIDDDGDVFVWDEV